MSQSNTRVGDFRVLAGESLTDKDGYLVKMTHDSGVAEVLLPEAITDYALYAVIEGAADAALVSVRPIEADRNVRTPYLVEVEVTLSFCFMGPTKL
jgi:hypothetical protein